MSHRPELMATVAFMDHNLRLAADLYLDCVEGHREDPLCPSLADMRDELEVMNGRLDFIIDYQELLAVGYYFETLDD